MHLCQQTTIDVYVYRAMRKIQCFTHVRYCICVGGLHLPHINVSPPAQQHLPTPLSCGPDSLIHSTSYMASYYSQLGDQLARYMKIQKSLSSYVFSAVNRVIAS